MLRLSPLENRHSIKMYKLTQILYEHLIKTRWPASWSCPSRRVTRRLAQDYDAGSNSITYYISPLFSPLLVCCLLVLLSYTEQSMYNKCNVHKIMFTGMLLFCNILWSFMNNVHNFIHTIIHSNLTIKHNIKIYDTCCSTHVT